MKGHRFMQLSGGRDRGRDIPAYAMRRSGVLPHDTSSLKSLSNAAMSCQWRFQNSIRNEQAMQYI